MGGNDKQIARQMANAPQNKTAEKPAAAPTVIEDDPAVEEVTGGPATADLSTSTDAPANVAQAWPANKFDRLYAAVHFSSSDSGRTFENERNKTKSRKVANVLLEMRDPQTGIGSGVYIKGSIYARQKPGQKKPVAEFSYFGANMQTCLSFNDASTKADGETFKAAVAKKYALWLRENPIQQQAAAAGGEAVELDGISLE